MEAAASGLQAQERGKMPPRRISLDQYETFKDLVAPPAKTEGDKRRDEKQLMSQERMKRWPDTIEAQRRKKEENYRARLHAQENERLRIDAEEDSLRAARRKQIIDEAAKTIYRNTDKSKRLASAERLSDCLHVRDHQVALKQRIQEAEVEYNQRFVEMERESMARAKAREEKETNERSSMAKHIAQVQQEQLAEVRQRYVDALKEEQAIGLEMAEAARKQELEAIEMQKKRDEAARQNQKDVLQANKELLKMKSEMAAREAEEDAKIARYAAEKDALRARQKAQFEKIEKSKQQRRDEMIEQGIRRLQEINDSNNSRLEKEIAEARRLEDERMQRLADKRAAYARTIDESRKVQIKERIDKKEHQHNLDREAARRWREHNRHAEELERLEYEAEFQAAREHQAILLNQAQEKREREVEERRQRIFESRVLEDQAAVDLDDFKRAAKERIEKVKAQGKNPIPLFNCVNDVIRGK